MRYLILKEWSFSEINNMPQQFHPHRSFGYRTTQDFIAKQFVQETTAVQHNILTQHHEAADLREVLRPSSSPPAAIAAF